MVERAQTVKETAPGPAQPLGQANISSVLLNDQTDEKRHACVAQPNIESGTRPIAQSVAQSGTQPVAEPEPGRNQERAPEMKRGEQVTQARWCLRSARGTVLRR